MAEEDNGQEKTEEPTAKRIEKAREDGQVARSQELSVAAMMIGSAGFMYLFGASLISKLQQNFSSGFIFDRKDVFSESLLPGALGENALEGLLSVAPLFGFAILVALGSAGALGGYIFSLKALAPKASKINPLNGLKRMFGLKAVIERSKAVTKCALVGLVLYLVVSQSFSSLSQLGFMALEPALKEAGNIIALGTVLVTLTLIMAAAIDVPYQLHEFNKKLKMTKQEVKDELKDTEGRPEVKAQIRRKQREMAMGSMLEAVAEADVVIVNPEHFAVALSYDPSSSNAPVLVAKGVDFLAESIRDRASSGGVQIFSSPTLARAIYFTTDVNQPVPEGLYHAVAQVIAYVFSLNARHPASKELVLPIPEVPAGMRYTKDGKVQG